MSPKRLTVSAAGGASHIDEVPERPKPTQEEIRAEWRSSASLSPAEFFIAAKRIGALTPQEAVAAAKGGAPQAFIDYATQAEGVDEIEAQILFARMNVVERNHPFVLAMTAGIPPETVDAAFGYKEEENDQ